jgi:hypothetical protein
LNWPYAESLHLPVCSRMPPYAALGRDSRNISGTARQALPRRGHEEVAAAITVSEHILEALHSAPCRPNLVWRGVELLHGAESADRPVLSECVADLNRPGVPTMGVPLALRENWRSVLPGDVSALSAPWRWCRQVRSVAQP